MTIYMSIILLQLDSLKPKESLVIRQRYGLDGKGDRTLGEIGGNLNISREMVRKHEVKAFMKLKHPARVDYLRRYILWKKTKPSVCVTVTYIHIPLLPSKSTVKNFNFVYLYHSHKIQWQRYSVYKMKSIYKALYVMSVYIQVNYFWSEVPKGM